MSARFVRLPLVLVSVLLLFALVGFAATAQAQAPAPAPDSKTAAKEHYTRGTSFYDLGKYDDAIREFEAAYQLKNDPAFLYNLAQSYRQAGNHEQAVHFYKTYLRYVPKAPNRADIEEKIKTEEQLIAKGSGTTPPPTTTTPPAGTTTPPPGTTTPPPGGDQPVVTLPPPATPPPSTFPNPYAPPPPATTEPSDPGRKFRIAGIATAGGGALMMVLGIVEYTRAKSASDDIEAAARANRAFDPDVEDRGKSAETLQWVFYGLGALAVGAGAGLFFYGQHVTAAETTTWRVSLAPTIAPDRGGATLRISF